MNNLKERLKNQESVLGTFLKITDPAIVEIAGYAEMDFIIIDMEHGPINVESAQNLIRAAEVVDICPIIRVTRNEETDILRALDIGAYGVEVPQINTKSEAEKLVAAAKYAPQGQRGVCRYVRAAKYSSESIERYFKTSNEENVLIAHLEGEEGLRNLEDIISVPDIDVIFIGPYDLSQSLGITGEVNNPKLINEMEKIVDKCKTANKVVGTFVENIESAKQWKEKGVQYLAYSVDVGLLYEAFKSIKINIFQR